MSSSSKKQEGSLRGEGGSCQACDLADPHDCVKGAPEMEKAGLPESEAKHAAALRRADSLIGEGSESDGEVSCDPEAAGKKKRKKKKKLVVNLTMCKYKVVSDCCIAMGWKETSHEVGRVQKEVFAFFLKQYSYSSHRINSACAYALSNSHGSASQY
jgi:hypothetical protein